MSFPFNVVLQVFLNMNLSCALFPRRFLSEHGKIRWFVLCTMNLTVFGISHLLLSSRSKSIYSRDNGSSDNISCIVARLNC